MLLGLVKPFVLNLIENLVLGIKAEIESAMAQSTSSGEPETLRSSQSPAL